MGCHVMYGAAGQGAWLGARRNVKLATEISFDGYATANHNAWSYIIRIIKGTKNRLGGKIFQKKFPIRRPDEAVVFEVVV